MPKTDLYQDYIDTMQKAGVLNRKMEVELGMTLAKYLPSQGSTLSARRLQGDR